MGNPHAILIVDDICQEIETIAKKIQSSADFPVSSIIVIVNKQFHYTLFSFYHNIFSKPFIG
jgi:diaminopimelate epimerase